MITDELKKSSGVRSSNDRSKERAVSPGPRTKSSLRLRYDAEVSVIQKKLGDLDTIRMTLGLSKRKICQLLLVDPSAWTRWNRPGEDAPPHVYRSLQWYLALYEKYPALDVNFWLSATAPVRDANEALNQGRRIQTLETTVFHLEAQLNDVQEQHKGRLWLIGVVSAIVGSALTLVIANF